MKPVKAPAPSKLEATLDSRNFYVSLITLFFLILGYNNIEIENPEALADEILKALEGKNVALVLTIFSANLINPLLKLFRSKFNTAFLKSANFWTQAGTVLLMGLQGIGILFPENGATEIVNAVFGGDITLIVIAILVNIANPLFHFFRKEKA